MSPEPTVRVDVTLLRYGGPVDDDAYWTGDLREAGNELGTARGESPGEVLEDLALMLDERETDLIVQARRIGKAAEENARELRTREP